MTQDTTGLKPGKPRQTQFTWIKQTYERQLLEKGPDGVWMGMPACLLWTINRSQVAMQLYHHVCSGQGEREEEGAETGCADNPASFPSSAYLTHRTQSSDPCSSGLSLQGHPKSKTQEVWGDLIPPDMHGTAVSKSVCSAPLVSTSY